MSRLKAIGSIAVVLTASSLGVASPAGASTDGCAPASSMSTSAKAFAAPAIAPSQSAVIRDVRVGHHDGCDRVTIEYTGVPSATIEYVPKVVADASGKTVSLEGSAFIRVVLGHTSTTHPAPQPDLKPAFPVLREVQGAGDFEGTTSYGLGLSSKQPFAVTQLTSPDRLVIDIHVPGQVTKVPNGGVATGDGSTSQFPRTPLLVLAAVLIMSGAGLFMLRHRIVVRR